MLNSYYWILSSEVFCVLFNCSVISSSSFNNILIYWPNVLSALVMTTRKVHLVSQIPPQGRHKQPKAKSKPVPEVTRPLDGGYGWVIVVASFVCNTIVDGIANSFGIFMDTLSTSFHEDKGNVAFASSVNVGMHLLVGPLVGALCKRYSCRVVCIAGSILSSLALVLSVFASNTMMFTLLYGILGGTGFGLVYISTVILVSYYFELKRSLAVGISLCGSGFGTFLFPPLSEFILKRCTWQSTHLIFAGFTLSCTLVSLLLLPLEHFQSKTFETKMTSSDMEEPFIRPKTSRGRRSQIWHRKSDVLSSVVEDNDMRDEGHDVRLKSKDKSGTNQILPPGEHREFRSGSKTQLKNDSSVEETYNIQYSKIVNTQACTNKPLNNNNNYLGNPTTADASEIAAKTQLQKKDILKILLFTRIVLKKDYRGSKLPLFSRKILNGMKSLSEINEIINLDYELLDFYEIKRSKSEDLTLLQHYFSHVEINTGESQINIGESLPSDLNHFVYILNDIKETINDQHEQVTEYKATFQKLHFAEQNYSYDEQQAEETIDPVHAVSARNVKSMPVLDQIKEEPFLREAKSSHIGGPRPNEMSEHVRFVSNLFDNAVTATKNDNWKEDDLESLNSDYSFRPHETIPQIIVSCDRHDNVEDDGKMYRSSDCAAWWNSSSSVRKDMYFTGSINILKEYQQEADEETYRKRNTVQVSLLQDMWDRQLLCNPMFILFILSNVFLLAGYYIPYIFLVDTAKSLLPNITSAKASYLMSALGVANMLGRIFFGFLDNFKLMDSHLLNNLSLIVSALSILSLPYCFNYMQYVLTAGVLGFSQACVVSLTTTLLVQLFTLDKLTNSFGMLQMFRGIAIVLGITCSGYLFKWTQCYQLVYWLSAGFYLLSIVFGFIVQCATSPDTSHSSHDLSDHYSIQKSLNM
uniref:Monocarboxylate transporter 14 n=1 Tax=Cacopsylla melanoneura TaxID=428564 RepID=A0A8D8X9T0_9HEMI